MIQSSTRQQNWIATPESPERNLYMASIPASDISDRPWSGEWTATALVVILCTGISISNAIELLLLVVITFKRRTGLYFWSLLVTSCSILPYSVGFFIAYISELDSHLSLHFNATNPHTSDPVGFWMGTPILLLLLMPCKMLFVNLTIHRNQPSLTRGHSQQYWLGYPHYRAVNSPLLKTWLTAAV